MTHAAVLDQPLTGAPTRELVAALSAAFDEPAWLREQRLRALDHFQALGWPTGQEEVWRRTPMTDVPLERYHVVQRASQPTPADAALLRLAGEDRGGVLAQVDNVTIRQDLSAELAAQGVLLLPLAQAARDYEALVRPHLHSIVPLDYDRFTALSGALWTQGLFCYVPRGVTIDQPLLSLIGKSAADQGLFGHTLIVAEPGSALTLVEIASSEDAAGAGLSHRSVEVIAKEGAQVRLIQVQHWGSDVSHFVTQRARLDRDAHLLTASTVFGGRLHKERIEVDSAGNGSSTDLLGLFVGTDAQYIEFNTRQNQIGVGTTSQALIKGALDDQANAVQYGVVKIFPTGQRTNAFQTFRNLLLSASAGADPIPVLEIEADDVKCGHAAAVGPVDPEHLFYLQSRGIPAPEAERMIVLGFLEVVVDRIQDPPTRALIEHLIEAKLTKGAPA